MNSEKTIIYIAIIAFIFFVGVIVYNFVDFVPEKVVTTQGECPPCIQKECEQTAPKVIEYPVEVEKIVNTTTTVEVMDEQCQKDFAEYKAKWKSAIYSWQQKH